jgi:WD40 repeat protein
MSSLAFFPDGKILVAGGFEPKLLAWNVEDGKELASVTLTQAVINMQVSPDGKSMLAPGDPVIVWDTSTWKERGTIKPGGLSVAFQPGTRMVAVAGGRTVKFWDMDSWKENRSIDVMAFQLAFSPDGKLIATGTGPQGVTLVDAESGKVVRTLKEDRPSPMARFEFCAGGKVLVKANTDQTVTLFDVDTGKVLRKVKTPGTDNFKVHSLRVTADGKTFAWVTSDRPSVVKVLRLD